MRTSLFLVAISLSCAACGSDSKDGTTTGANGAPSPGKKTSLDAFDPPPVSAGYTRIVSPTVHDVGPGGDVTYCQYVMAPLDRDQDVIDVQGYQSKFGHHAVAFSYTPADGEEIGSNLPCMGTEFSAPGDGGAPATGQQGSFLGATRAADVSKSASSLPDGVAFRLPKGQGVMLNVHYLNTSEDTIDGNAVVDLKFADTDPTRKIAALFTNLNLGFNLSPDSPTTSTVDCVAKSDVQFIMMTNHMHEFGTSATTEVKRAGTDSFEMAHDDATWTYDMQFNPDYTRWTIDSPFVIHTGDTIRTTCNWNNTTSNTLTFPREMCLGVGFALATGDKPTVPICVNGNWVGG